MNPSSPDPASHLAVLEVERAASDLRRGQPVTLVDAENNRLHVRSGEHFPEIPALTDPHHPAVRLLKLAGLLPRAVVESLSADNPSMLTVTASAIAEYPAALAESLVQVSEAVVPLTGATDARIIAFRPRFGHEEHLAVIIGDPTKQSAPFVRIHSSCVTGDVFGSLRCDCGGQLKKAVEIIADEGGGAIIYLSQEGRGIGIANKLRAYTLQDKGLDTVEANEALGFAPDERDFAIAARMLAMLGLTRITLLTNNPEKIEAIVVHGIKVVNRVPLVMESNAHNERYLDTKALKMGHQF
jgi:GTP cyclohydrolase II